MTAVIYESEKKAKVYEIKAAKDQDVYSKDELVYTVKTDDIKAFLRNTTYDYIAIEKSN